MSNVPRLCPSECCTGCSACAVVCPSHAITMQPDSEGFLHPVIDLVHCTYCRLCERTCPVLHRLPPREPLEVYAAVNRDNKIRLQSSSGGIFSLLAQHVLNGDGIVFGAGWSGDLRVIHHKAENEIELADLRGTKYVQSEIGDCYQQTKVQLDRGRKVLFSGTPCQIAGLRAFLQKDYSNLLCVNLICFGVPSPMVFAQYKQYLEKKHDSQIKTIYFRSKKSGWRRSVFEVAFQNGEKYQTILYEDVFFKGFGNALFNRESCRSCPFRDLRSGADMTIGDFWGIETLFPDMDDDRGVSVILLNNEKGLAYRQWLAEKASLRKTTYAEVILHNPMLVKQAQAHPKRAWFFKQMRQKRSFTITVDRALRISLYNRCRSVGGRFLRRLGLRR